MPRREPDDETTKMFAAIHRNREQFSVEKVHAAFKEALERKAMFNLTKFELACLRALIREGIANPPPVPDYEDLTSEVPKALQRVYVKLHASREELTKGQP